MRKKLLIFAFFAGCFPWQWASAAPKKIAGPGNGAADKLWNDPTDIATRDLEWGPGGKDHAPQGTLTFEKEDMDGTSAKFVARDENGVKWKVKMGSEVHSETAADRIVWAVGYYADEDYFLPSIRVRNLPAKLKRGQEYSVGDGLVINVRLKRYLKDEKNAGEWKWSDNPFNGTREMNGLRVMMALINNWDLKDENNKVYRDKDTNERIYLVSDLGASFGSNGRERTREESKGNLKKYQDSEFITHDKNGQASFATPGREALVLLPSVGEYERRSHMQWIGKGIPSADAHWIGGILAKLSPDQIRAAFRSAGFDPEEVEGYTAVVQNRIAQLNGLPE